MARSPVTTLLDQFNNLTPEEAKVFLDLVAPEPEPEAPKQTRKKRVARTPKQTGLPKAEASNGALCIAQVPGLDVPCRNTEENGIHDPNGGYGGYHPFVSSAPIAAKRSRQKKEGTSSTPSSEGEAASAMSASSGGG